MKLSDNNLMEKEVVKFGLSILQLDRASKNPEIAKRREERRLQDAKRLQAAKEKFRNGN